MLFDGVNLQDELDKEEKGATEASLINAVNEILVDSVKRDRQLVDRLYGNSISSNSSHSISIPDTDRVYSEETIQAVCTKFRLRFLGTKLFKGEIPYEALQKIRNFESEHGTEASAFKIMAPANRFRLKDSTSDPLLFADLGNGSYHLLHQWGNDLAWYKKLTFFPLRNMYTLAITALLIGFFLALLVPAKSLLSDSIGTISIARIVYFKFFASFILAGLVFVTGLIIGIVSIRDFSENVWNSRFFN